MGSLNLRPAFRLSAVLSALGLIAFAFVAFVATALWVRAAAGLVALVYAANLVLIVRKGTTADG